MNSRQVVWLFSPGDQHANPTPISVWYRLAFFVQEGSEGEKGESRPIKDRLCPDTTPYSQSIQTRRG